MYYIVLYLSSYTSKWYAYSQEDGELIKFSSADEAKQAIHDIDYLDGADATKIVAVSNDDYYT